MDLEPKLLRAYLAIYDAPTITAAARALGVSQPTMSGHLRRLRDHLGDALFEFRNGKLHHTTKADEVHPEIVSIVDGLDRLASNRFRWSPSTSDRTFRLRASSYVQDLLAAGLDQRLRTAGSDLRLDIASSGFPNEASYDLIIAPRETLSPGQMMRIVFSERLVCLVDPTLAPTGKVPLDLFCELQHLLVAPAPSPPHDAVDQALAALGRSRRVARVVSAGLDLAPMLLGTRRVAILPERSARRYSPKLTIVPVPLTLVPITFAMAWAPARDSDPSHRWFRQEVRAEARLIPS